LRVNNYALKLSFKYFKLAPNSISPGVPVLPQTPLGELTALPQTPSCISRAYFYRVVEGKGRGIGWRVGEWKGKGEGKGK